MKTHRRILIAEKEQIEGAYVRGMLERKGWQAEVVLKSSEVLERIKGQTTYDAVIISSELSGADGIELVQQVRTESEDLPIIGMANYSLSAERKRFETAGVTECLTKPVYKASLLKALQQIFKAGSVSAA